MLLAGGIALLTAIRSRALSNALAHQASHDSLTGLPNRTHLRGRLERELAVLDAPGQSVTLMVLDLDGGRFHLSVEDIKELAPSVLRHRIILNFDAHADGKTADNILATIISGVTVHASAA